MLGVLTQAESQAGREITTPSDERHILGVREVRGEPEPAPLPPGLTPPPEDLV